MQPPKPAGRSAADHDCADGAMRLLPSPYLQVPVDEPVGLKVIIILPKRVDELFGHLHVESTQQGSRSCPPFSLQEEGPWG